jgi:hypothetical protein
LTMNATYPPNPLEFGSLAIQKLPKKGQNWL